MFNHMYLNVTMQVNGQVCNSLFADRVHDQPGVGGNPSPHDPATAREFGLSRKIAGRPLGVARDPPNGRPPDVCNWLIIRAQSSIFCRYVLREEVA
jgi:hypothetical protein